MKLNKLIFRPGPHYGVNDFSSGAGVPVFSDQQQHTQNFLHETRGQVVHGCHCA